MQPSDPMHQQKTHPEMATTAAWRVRAKAARKAKGLTQKQLADKVGCSQANVSEIENGEVVSSWLVVPISIALEIPPPQTSVADEVDQRWIESGRRLAAMSPTVFESMLEAVERLAAAEEAASAKPKKK